MCGIVGFAGAGDIDDLRAMTSALEHRGPDGEGYFVADGVPVFLGHRRLAILDIEGGSQPMWDAERTTGVTYNGEIYNHLELRAELEAKGHVFKTSHSDTEVLVHGYKEWGQGLPSRLNGMFAFAIFDATRNWLFLSRDRFGEKPLYYTNQNGFFGFGSELSALTRHRCFDCRLDQRSLQKFFAYGFLPAPNALYENCRKLPGGASLVFDLTTEEVALDCYWRFTLDPDAGLSDKNEDDLAEDLAERISRSVKRRLIADVPVGVFLSGGIDSSAVLSMAARHSPVAALKTFTVGFTETSFDESHWAANIASAFGTDHRVEILDLDAAMGLIHEVLSRMDEPLGDASLLPTYLLSRFTREQVTVALSGDGGDELFAGYDPFKALAPAQLYDSAVPGFVHKGLRKLATLLPISDRNMSFDYKLRSALKGLSQAPGLWNPVWLSPLDPTHAADMFDQPLPIEELYSEALEQWNRDDGLGLVDRTLEFYTNFYLPDDILTKVDRASMMVSLETRAVYLDNDIVNFCRRLPAHFKYRNGDTKYLLKKAVRKLLPKQVIGRPKKGFGIPLSRWLREMPSKPDQEEILGVKDPWLSSCWTAHRNRKRDHRLLLWSWLSLQQCIAGTKALSKQPIH